MYQPSIAEKVLLFAKGGTLLLAGGAIAYFSWVLWAKHQNTALALVIALLGLLIVFLSIRFVLKAAKSKFIMLPGNAMAEHLDINGAAAQEINALLALLTAERYSEAISLALTMTERFPLNGFGWKALGAAYMMTGRSVDARGPVLNAVALLPNDAVAHYNLGALLQDINCLPEAEAAYRRTLELDPNYANAHNNLGVLLYKTSRLHEAEGAYRRALQIKPDYVEAYNNLGNALMVQGRLNEAEASYRRALQIKPDFAEAHNNLGNALMAQGRLDEAEASFRRALQIKPDYVNAHSNLIFISDFSASEDAASLEAKRKAWGERHAAPLFQERAFSNTLDPERRLRIGYVSADFREHSAARSFEGILLHLDRQQYDIYAYSNNTYEDAFTQRFKQNVIGWRNIAGLSDDEVTDLIRQDQIDILVDLSGHTAGNRLLVFARKPAPIQINHAIGTGVKAIDVFFTDAVMVPPEEQSLYTETVRYLPCALCYSSDADLPPVNALPALQQPTITLGSFNRLCKVTDATIALWSRVLQAIPDSRLILKTGELDDETTRARLTERLVRAGIDTDRIELKGKTNWAMHMAAFNDIDIALDPFPQGGGITALEGLLMGIPVITLRFPTITGRCSASILTTLGMTDWIAETEDAYVALAVSKARDKGALATLRSTLRERIKGSVLGDVKAYVKSFEAEYRELWRAWVQKQIKHVPEMARVSEAQIDRSHP